MRKQALAFFTMLSLILMLSIYYITMPKETNTNIQEQTVIANIENESETKKAETTSKNNEILSNKDASIEEKEQAIIENEKVKETQNIEKKIESLIAEEGYESSVEIKEKTIHVAIKHEKDDKVASKIMKLIYQNLNYMYFIEITFVSE